MKNVVVVVIVVVAAIAAITETTVYREPMCYLPVAQVGPVYPAGHWHWNLLIKLVHLPPFMQGRLVHSSKSVKRQRTVEHGSFQTFNQKALEVTRGRLAKVVYFRIRNSVYPQRV